MRLYKVFITKFELNNSFYVTKAIEYIEKNTFTNLSVNDIARYLKYQQKVIYMHYLNKN